MNVQIAKLILAVALDILDFTIGRIPGFELAFDIILGFTAVSLWGWPGLFAFWEIGDPTGQFDGFVPTMTIIAITQMRKEQAQRSREAQQTPRS